MTTNRAITQAIEQLGYRATAGDIAATAGININLAEPALLALAADASARLQVTESGEIIYLFPSNFRAILGRKFWQLRLREWWEKVWRVLYYLIRISFGIILIISIILIFLAIAVILITISSSRSDSDRDDSSSTIILPHFWFTPDLFWYFDPNPDRQLPPAASDRSNMNFLVAVFSFLFGDGNPNADLEPKRSREIAAAIRHSGGAVAAEQIAPYLDNLGSGSSREYEDYMLPVLVRFNGRPEVSPAGDIIYCFPELQVTASQERAIAPTSFYLEEQIWQFSQADSGQISLAIGLGMVNIIGAVVLGTLLATKEVALMEGGLIVFIQSIYWFLAAYGTAFLAIPLIRYLWLQRQNEGIRRRNEERYERALLIEQPPPELQAKIAFAQQFARSTAAGSESIAYTTETDLIEQEITKLEASDRNSEEQNGKREN